MKKNIKIAAMTILMSLMVAFSSHADEIATPSNAVKAEVTVESDNTVVEDEGQVVEDVVVSDDDNDEYVVESEVESESNETVNSGSKDSESGDSFFDFPEVPEEPKDEQPEEPKDIPVATPSEPQRIPTHVVVTVTVPDVPDEPKDEPVATPSDAEKPEEPEDEPKETPDQPQETPEEPEQPKDEPVATPSNAEKPEETPDQPEQPENHPEQPEEPDHRVPQIPDSPVIRIVDEPVPESVEPIVVIPVYPGGDESEHAVPAPVAEEVVPEYPATMTIPKTGDETPLYPVFVFFAALIGMVISAIGMARNGEADETVAYTAARKAAATASVRESTNNTDSLFGYNNLYSKANKNFQHLIGECHTNVRGFPPFETWADNIHPPLE